MTIEEAIKLLRLQPQYQELIHYTYLDEDTVSAAERFARSEEFAEVLRLVGDTVKQGIVVDLGAGTGIASYAFAVHDARLVLALEPDPSDIVGQGAVIKFSSHLPIQLVSAYGEAIPLTDGSVDLVYVRQVLHHTLDLDLVLRECHRVLKPGGYFLACREHVVNDEAQLQSFWMNHPIHQLTGGENAFTLAAYRHAITASGLKLVQEFAPFDNIINTYPNISAAGVEDLIRAKLRRFFGSLGDWIGRLPGVDPLGRSLVNWRNRTPGRLYSFLAQKEG